MCVCVPFNPFAHARTHTCVRAHTMNEHVQCNSCPHYRTHHPQGCQNSCTGEGGRERREGEMEGDNEWNREYQGEEGGSRTGNTRGRREGVEQ